MDFDIVINYTTSYLNFDIVFKVKIPIRSEKRNIIEGSENLDQQKKLENCFLFSTAETLL